MEGENIVFGGSVCLFVLLKPLILAITLEWLVMKDHISHVYHSQGHLSMSKLDITIAFFKIKIPFNGQYCFTNISCCFMFF